ncbi:peptidoglycan DD-metalloendopeptidase family protein [Balneolales bacterium ANBcel1]|nr:peptidoglycan DD-metalloendopeptidase family protein [Balneolales bacterium ANBcel1]
MNIEKPHDRAGNAGFHPVVRIDDRYRVLDLSRGYDPNAISLDPPSIGRYNEKRRDMYRSVLFGGVRDIHMGLDFWVPEGTPVYAFADGEVLMFRDNANDGDYGPTIITRHEGPVVRHLLKQIRDRAKGNRYGQQETAENTSEGALFALYGHLSRGSLSGLFPGMPFGKGQQIALVGGEHENGGWAPHLHFQLSLEPPSEPDMPGVVSERDLPEALGRYPDPALVTGRYY